MTSRLVKVDPVADAEVLRGLHEACFPGFPIPSFAGDWWIAKEGPVLHGFCGLWPSQRVEAAGYLCRAGVLPGARGRGLQRRMIRAREREARRKGWLALFSDTDPTNAPSQRNLIDCGYRPFRPTEPWQGDCWVYWRKVLEDGIA